MRQFEQTGEGWAERVVVLGGDGKLAFALAAPTPANRPLIPASLRDAAEGSVVEVCPAALNIAAFLGHRLARQPGAALVVDYGPARPTPGGTP